MKRVLIIVLILLGSSSLSVAQSYSYKSVNMQYYNYPNVCINTKKSRPPSPRYSKYRIKARKIAARNSNKRFNKKMRKQRSAIRKLSRR
jgi:hypothetical protein